MADKTPKDEKMYKGDVAIDGDPHVSFLKCVGKRENVQGCANLINDCLNPDDVPAQREREQIPWFTDVQMSNTKVKCKLKRKAKQGDHNPFQGLEDG